VKILETDSLPYSVVQMLNDTTECIEDRVIRAAAVALREGVELPGFATSPWTLGALYRRLSNTRYPTPRISTHGEYVSIATPLGIRRLYGDPGLDRSDDALVVLAEVATEAPDGVYERLIIAAEALMELAQRYR